MGDCAKHGEKYSWCRIYDGTWDHCVPEVIEKIKLEREKDRQKSGSRDHCKKEDAHGWYDGIYEMSLYADKSPDGLRWTWVQCASRCAEEMACEFWTLQMNKEYACLLMSNQGDFHADPYAISGGKKNLCQAEQPSLLQTSNVEAQFSHEDAGSHGGQNGSMYQDCLAPTSRGHCCQNEDRCQMIGSGKEFQWCCTTESEPSACNKWDYCSSDGKTSKGFYCTGDCAKHGEKYSWCRIYDGTWDHCVPEVIEKIKLEREKDRQKSGSRDHCKKEDAHGWYDGIYEMSLYADKSPDGLRWTWVQCASRCAEEMAC